MRKVPPGLWMNLINDKDMKYPIAKMVKVYECPVNEMKEFLLDTLE